jgi:hypothetical protein
MRARVEATIDEGEGCFIADVQIVKIDAAGNRKPIKPR